ncbi:MAG: FeoA family protein [candidate division WOR-3 bacterium]|nr:FeoA family protein [candidate division WOR-3 bacterium]
MNKKDKQSYPLTLAAEYEEVIVHSLHGGRQFRGKCINLGLIPGKRIIIMNKNFRGPCVVKVNDSKIMIGNKMLSRIFVTKE